MGRGGSGTGRGAQGWGGRRAAVRAAEEKVGTLKGERV